MDNEIILPNSKHIDIDLGLKYLNGNKKLYLKVLNSFLTRYEALNIEILDEHEFKDTMHTIKGLSATLGMEELSFMAKNLYDVNHPELQKRFSKTLGEIIYDLKALQIKTILIIDDIIDDIDIIVETLSPKYDIIVTTTLEDALKSLAQEKINLILLNNHLHDDIDSNAQQLVESQSIPIVYLKKPLDSHQLIVSIPSL